MHRVAIVGSGAVATHLAVGLVRGCVREGCVGEPEVRLVQVWGRRESRVGELLDWLGGGADGVEGLVGDEGLAAVDADVILVSVSDRAIEDVYARLPVGVGLVAHTSGGTPLLDRTGGGRSGVFYPYYTFTPGRSVDFSEVHLLVEGSDSTAYAQLAAVGEHLGARIHAVDSRVRLHYHLLGVWVNNFVNILMVKGEEYCIRNGLDSEYLLPLLSETVSKGIEMGWSASQTGPARRCDEVTLLRHRALLEGLDDGGEMVKIYDALSGAIRSYFREEGR